MVEKYVIKKDGRIEKWQREKVENAIRKAFEEVGSYSEDDIKTITRSTLYKITQIINDAILDPLSLPQGIKIEDDKVFVTTDFINDTIEISLMSKGYYDVAKKFILFRQKKEEERKEKMKIWGLDKWIDDVVLKFFSTNALRVLSSRYPIKDKEGKILETPSEIFMRVATGIAIAELLYDKRVYDKDGGHKVSYPENIDFKKLADEVNLVVDFDGKLYKVNEFMWERIYSRFVELANEGKMKVDWYRFVELIKNDRITKSFREYAYKFYKMMVTQTYMPNTPAIVNTGRRLYMLSACFVVPMEDDMESIMKATHDVAMIQKSGGGTGIDFSKIRPEGDEVASTSGVASGPISFLRMIDAVSDVIKQGGVRRGANMGILRYDHPDIMKFIYAKRNNDGMSVLTTFNISVGIYEDFWKHLENGTQFPLVNPRDKSIWGYLDAREFFSKLAEMAWKVADPGVIYFDEINKFNALPKWGEITATNPCGEQPLHPYESCNLLSINVAKFVKYDDNEKPYFDWDTFREVVHIAIRMLNDIIDVNKYPLPELRDAILRSMRVGLGIMGLADALYMMNIPYNSEEGFDFMRKLSQALLYYAIEESIELAKERGPFPEFKESVWADGIIPVRGFHNKETWMFDWDRLVEEIKKYGIRNSGLTTMPPTGSVSMIADTSSGIEPNFALAFKKSVTIGEFYYVNKVLEQELRKRGLLKDEILRRIAEEGSLQDIEEIPEDMKKIFVTAMDIHYVDHIIAQSVIQEWTTEAVSKTINMPNNVTVEDVKLAYILGHYLGLKGVTIYRDGSLTYQVLSTEKKEPRKLHLSEYGKRILNDILTKHKWITDYVDTSKLTDVPLSAKNEKPKLFLSLSVDSQDGSNTNYASVTTNTKPNLYDDSIIKKYIGKVVADEDIEYVDNILRSKKLLGEVFCPMCWEREHRLSPIVFEAGCKTCKVCGWSACTIS